MQTAQRGSSGAGLEGTWLLKREEGDMEREEEEGEERGSQTEEEGEERIVRPEALRMSWSSWASSSMSRGGLDS
jgi:hypothetical protein